MDLFIDEATLTGESDPVEKTPGLLPPEAPLRRWTNSLVLGTAAFRIGWFLESVVSTLATGLIIVGTVLIPYSPLGGPLG